MLPRSTSLLNLGTVILNPSACPEEATIIVVGLGRSGTSMVAASLRALGIYAGKILDNNVHEDMEIAAAIDTDDRSRLEQLISERNAKHRKWAFKRPKAFRKLQAILPLFRNPRIIVTIRDPLAIGIRKNLSAHHDLLPGIRSAAADTVNLIDRIKAIDSPRLLVSYEKAVAYPENFCDVLCEFCGLTVPSEGRERLFQAIQKSPEEYLQQARLELLGEFCATDDGTVTGWIMTNGPIPELEFVVGDSVAATILCDRPIERLAGSLDPQRQRQDVRYFGFERELSRSAIDFTTLRVRVKDTVFYLRNQR